MATRDDNQALEEQRTEETREHPSGRPSPPGGYPPPLETNGFAIASLVLGIVWLMWVGSVLALIFGYIGKTQVDRSAGRQGGRGLAIAGIVLGWVGVGILLLFVILGLLGVLNMGSLMRDMPRMPMMPMNGH